MPILSLLETFPNAAPLNSHSQHNKQTGAAMLRRTLLAAPYARAGAARPLHTVGPGRKPPNSRSQSSSSTSPSTRSHQSQPQQRDAIDSLAMDADILAPPRTLSSATSRVSTSGSSSANPKTRRQPPDAWQQPRPVLKRNQYASTYSVSEKDLEEETMGLEDAQKESSRRPPPPKFRPHTTTTGFGRRKAQLTATKRQSSTPFRRKDDVSEGPTESLTEQPIRTLTLSPTETIDVRAGGLTFHREGTVKVLGYARLRDACPCPSCIHPSTRQKLRTSGQAYHSAQSMQWHYHAPSPTSLTTANHLGRPGLSVQWRDQDQKPHLSFYDADLIRALFCPVATPLEYLARSLPRKTWSGTEMTENATLRFQYDSIVQNGAPDRAVLLKVLEQLQVYGLAIVQGVPTEPTNDETCHLRAVANWIGEIRNTFYGETWDVKSVKDSKNVAYTSLDLGLHMDLLYFSSPPRFQALHCLRNRVFGGESYFVDAFRAVKTFRQEHPRGYSLLQQRGIDFEYDNDGHYLHCRHPLASYDLRSVRAAVNWSPPFQAKVRSARPVGPARGQTIQESLEDEAENYAALAAFETILGDPAAKYEFLMQEGDLVLFDNRRVLHARREFRDLDEAEKVAKGIDLKDGEPTRWLKGLYLDGEVVWDKLVTLRRDLEASSSHDA